MVTETELGFKIFDLAFAPISDDESDTDMDLGGDDIDTDEDEDEFSASPSAEGDEGFGTEEA